MELGIMSFADMQPETTPGNGSNAQQRIHELLEEIQLADQLGLATFAVSGMSAGAPYALHLAQLAPQRVVAVGLINPSAERTHAASRAIPIAMRVANRILTAWPVFEFIARYLRNHTQALSRRRRKAAA